MITTQHVFFLIGAMFAAYALLSLTDRSNKKRFGNAAFWGLLALSLIGGTWIGDFANGLVVLALAGIASLKLIGRGEPEVNEEQQTANGERYGDKLFLPILIVLLTAVLGTLLFLYVPPLAAVGWFEAKRETLVLLCAGVLLALVVLYLWLRPPAFAPLQEGRRLMDAVGWAAVLPLMLAAFGTVLKETGVGDLIGGIVGGAIPQGASSRPSPPLAGNGFVHHPHRQRLRRVSDHGERDRGAVAAEPAWRRPSGGRRNRYAGGVLRDLDDSDGGQL
jgi:uncharacterized membrane protein